MQKVTQKAANQDNEIRTLTKGDYFGEQVTDEYLIKSIKEMMTLMIKVFTLGLHIDSW